MRIAYLDEFGHIGPFISRHHKNHNTSPIFGLAGVVLPDSQARHLATAMLKLKQGMLAYDLKRAGMPAHSWEKKGTDLLTAKNLKRHPHVREGVRRILNDIRRSGGKIFYYGREKFQTADYAKANGLYSTVLGHTIRGINAFCCDNNDNFLVIMDQHSGRDRWMKTAAQTMFDRVDPARCLIEPPFEVESHLYQTIQLADWIATLVGRIQSFRIRPDEYPDWEWADRYFGKMVDQMATHSTIWRPSIAQRTSKN